MSEFRRVVSSEDRALGARIVRRVPMHYADGADEATDRPAFVQIGRAHV